jgi:hypothetical protein
MRGHIEDAACCSLCRKPARRLDLVEPLPDGADHPPAARVRAEPDCETRRDLHPDRDVELREMAALEQREREDTHRLLRVVRAVHERNEAAGNDLRIAKAAIRNIRARPAEDPIDRDQDDECAGKSERR